MAKKINDGKYLEDALQLELKKIKKTTFMWRRLHDASDLPGGNAKIPRQPSDFIISNGKSIHVELKSRKSKTCRLEKFDQFADMRRWALAGTPGFVIVHFYSVSEELYLVDVLDLDPSAKSWVLIKKFKNMEELVREFIK